MRARSRRRLRKSEPAPISRERNSRDADEERDECLRGGKESEPSLSEIAIGFVNGPADFLPV